MTQYQIAAVCYALWGVLHVAAAAESWRLAGTVDEGAVRGRLQQNAVTLLACAITVAIVAVRLNWYNSLLGYWINLVVASVVDIGFILFVLLPGHIALRKGLPGPILWLAGLILSTLALTV